MKPPSRRGCFAPGPQSGVDRRRRRAGAGALRQQQLLQRVLAHPLGSILLALVLCWEGRAGPGVGRTVSRWQLAAGGRRCERQASGRQGLPSCCCRRRLQPAAGPDLLYICACMPAQACCHAGRLVRYPGRRPSGGAPAHTVAASSSGASSRSSGAVRGRLEPICAASARCLAWPMAAERHCRASSSDGGFAGCGCHGKATVSYIDACERC